MKSLDRRRFLESASRKIFALSAAAALVESRRPARATPASEKVILGTIGLGGRGSRLSRDFAARGDCEIAYLCDVDPRRVRDLPKAIASAQGAEPRYVKDYRRLLEDRSVDAVVIATPDHWHGPGTVFSCQSGKDVYVEKPASHNIWEGRKMVEAARRYGRIVQVGTQNRSAPYVLKALEYIRNGGLGRIHLCKIYNLKSGGPYREPPDAPVPSGVDYDTWLGPRAKRPFNEGHFHRGWYYHWAYCGGDMGNDSIHQIDIARWLVGKDYPKAAHATGGNLAFDDDREVPDTQVATFDYDDLVLTFELTQWAPYMQKTNWQHRAGDSFPLWMQNATRIEFYGTRNLMVLGRHGGGWQVFTADGKEVARMHGRFPDAPHKENFLASIRSRELPSGDIEEGHRSAVLVHAGNISYRLGGRKLHFDRESESFRGDKEAARLLKARYRERFAIPDAV